MKEWILIYIAGFITGSLIEYAYWIIKCIRRDLFNSRGELIDLSKKAGGGRR